MVYFRKGNKASAQLGVVRNPWNEDVLPVKKLTLVLVLVILVGAAVAYGPYVFKPTRDRAEAECSSRLDSSSEYSINWVMSAPLPYYECVGDKGSVNLGWMP